MFIVEELLVARCGGPSRLVAVAARAEEPPRVRAAALLVGRALETRRPRESGLRQRKQLRGASGVGRIDWGVTTTRRLNSLCFYFH